MRPRDITGRVLGRPLRSPYAPGGGSPRTRWLWLVHAAWLLWAGVLSDHSWWRIAQLRHELGSEKSDLQRVRRETEALKDQAGDPALRTEHAEEELRKRGMAKPGEIIYRLGTGHPDSAQTSAIAH